MTQSILNRLHQQHGSFLTAGPASWRIWAADIATHPTANHERLIETGAPPAHVALHFRTKDVAAAVARQEATSGLNRSAIKTCRKQQALLKDRLKSAVALAAELQRHVIALQSQVDAFDLALETFEDLNEGIEEDSSPVAVPSDLELGPEDDASDEEHR